MIKTFVKKNRHTIRLSKYHYSDWGRYFITLKTEKNRHLFGFIQSGKMILNDFGRIVAQEWEKTAQIRPDVKIDEYIIMPDHIHGIIIIDPSRRGDPRSPMNNSNVSPMDQHTPGTPPLPGYRITPTGGIIAPQSASLAAILSGFKSAVTRQINQARKTTVPQVWQRNYYERIIRYSGEFYNVRQYIRNNASNWNK
ncbi:MAG: transposase [Bacteroidia bacterium]|nr:transposase [Bacteroidia bacterium]